MRDTRSPSGPRRPVGANRVRVLLAGGLLLAAVPALAAPGDDLAREIGRDLQTVTVQVRAQPERALAGIAEQRRRLETLARDAPDHPAIPDLRRRIDELDESLARPTATAGMVAAPPSDIARLLDRVRARLREAEGALLSRDIPRAGATLQEIETSLAELRRDRSDEIPQGHVAAFTLEERIAVLKRQLADATARERR